MSRPLAGSAQRVLALLPILLVTGLLAVATGEVGRRNPPRLPVPDTFPALPLPHVRTPAAVWSREIERGRPFVALYISDSCPHCVAELARWDSLLVAHHSLRDRLRLVVIHAPHPTSALHSPRFASVELRDAAGALAAQLRLRTVPTRYVVSAEGRILEQQAGQTGPRALLTLFTRLAAGAQP